MEPLLELKNVQKVYPITGGVLEALKNVSFTIEKGEIISLLGVNGAGKTTLSSILATLHPATAGTILYQGQNLYSNLIAFRKQLGFCPQRPNFDGQLTVEENLFFSGNYYGIPSVTLKKRVAELLEQFDLQRYKNAYADILSGGYKQRLLIARALVHRPMFIILDEPTVALDPHVRRQIWDAIMQLKQEGVTVLLTTHYLDEAEILSDRVCILDKGMVKLIDRPENLLSAFNKSRLEDVFLEIVQEQEAS